eukprot:jgi/Tetstr1/430186/TSEL_020017.t1
MTYVAKWCLHADKREDTGPGDACYLLTLVPAALTPVARLGSISSMTEHAANTELPGLIAPAAAHWVELRMDWLALLPTLPPWRAAPSAAPSPHGSAHQLPPHLPPPAQAETDPTSDFQLLGGMPMEIQKQMAAQTAVVALLRDEMAERRRETSHLNNVVTALQAGAPLISQMEAGLAECIGALAENHGVAEPSAENIKELRRLFPPPTADDPSGLLPPPEPDDMPSITVCPDDLHGVLQRAPADSACHRDGWRVDHLRDLSDDSDTLQSMARFMTVVCSGNVSDRAKQLLSSSTLIPL